MIARHAIPFWQFVMLILAPMIAISVRRWRKERRHTPASKVSVSSEEITDDRTERGHPDSAGQS